MVETVDVEAEIILGGLGFVGTHLARTLRWGGADVLVYDLKNGYDLRVAPPPVPTRRCYVWFLAWDVGGAKFLLDETYQLEILRSNLALCETIFPWIAENSLNATFIGTQMAGYRNAYGLTKLIGEYWAALTPGCIISRLWNVFGIEDPSDRSHVVSDLTRSGEKGCVRCLTSGRERRQFLYVKDCVAALLHQRGIQQPIADITSCVWTPVREVAEIIAREIGVPVTFGEEPGYENIVEPWNLLAGWRPSYSLVDGIVDMLREAKII